LAPGLAGLSHALFPRAWIDLVCQDLNVVSARLRLARGAYSLFE
jgi:hypothetical protein